MLNCINGFYYPTEGRITFKGVKRPKMRPYEAARGGIARTFQNVALFKSMSTLDNIMAGRSIKMRSSFLWQLFRHGPAIDRKSTRLNSSHANISYAVFCLKKKN